MNIRYSHRLFLYAPYIVLLALAMAASLRWWVVSSDFQDWLSIANRGREIAPGVTLHYASEKLSGFPFNVDAVLQDVTVKVAAPRGPFLWRTEHFAIHKLTYGRVHEIFEAAGRQSLFWTDANGGSHRFDFVPGLLRASAISAGGRLARFDLDIGALGSPVFSAARLQLHVRQVPDRNEIGVFASADTLHLSPALQSVLGTDVGRLTLAGQFTQRAKLLSLLAGDEAWPTAAENWRQDAGMFAINALAITSGKLQARAVGTLALDPAHRMRGDLNLSVTDANTIAVQNHVRNRFTATLVRLTKDAPAHSDKRLEVNVAIDAGKVSVRPLRGTWQSAGLIDRVY